MTDPIAELREHLVEGRFVLNDASIDTLLACCAESLDQLGTPEPYRGRVLSEMERALRIRAALARLNGDDQ